MSNSNTPKKGTPKSTKSNTPKGKKESWLWNDSEDEFVLSSDNDCLIKTEQSCVENLTLVDETGDDIPEYAISNELKDDVVFLSADTMGKAGFCLGDLVYISASPNVCAAAIVWPKVQARLGTIIPSNNMKSLFKESGTSVYVTKLENKKQVCHPKIVYARVFRSVKAPPITLSEEKCLCKYLQRMFTGKYLVDKQVHKTIFGGRRVQVTFHCTESSLEEELEQLSLSETKRIYKIRPETSFVITNLSKRSLGKKENACIEEKYFSDSLIKKVNDEIITYLSNWDEVLMPPPKGFILYGQSGVGKTEILKLISCRLLDNFKCVWVNNVDEYKTAVENRDPSLILIDNFENFCSKDTEKTFLREFIEAIDNAPKTQFFICATNRLDLVDERLRTNGRLEVEIEVPIPGTQERGRILAQLAQKLPLDNVRIRELAGRLHGFVASDIISLMMKATAHVFRTRSAIDNELLMSLAKQIVPSAMKTMAVSVKPVKWRDIGGGERMRRSLVQLVEWPLKYAAEMKKLKIDPPRGVLLYGPPGCSKTMIAKALATESSLKFLTIKGAELISKYVGDSEKAIRNVFQKARQSAPAILFFDEIDAVAVTRGEQNSVVTDRMITTLLTELDGITDDADNNPVILVAATNRPHMIDSALLRPGRIDRFEYVPLPNKETRRDIFKKNLPSSFENEDLDILADRTSGYSGAEIVSIKQEAALVAMERMIKGDVGATVTVEDIEGVLERLKPRTKQCDLDLFRDFATAHGQTISEEHYLTQFITFRLSMKSG